MDSEGPDPVRYKSDQFIGLSRGTLWDPQNDQMNRLSVFCMAAPGDHTVAYDDNKQEVGRHQYIRRGSF